MPRWTAVPDIRGTNGPWLENLAQQENDVKRLACFLVALAPLNLCAAKLRVMTTTSDLSALAQAIGGDQVETQSLAKGRQDPHFIDAKPSYMLDAHKADLFIRVGLELEIGYEPLILEGARNPKILVNARGHLDASEGVPLLEVPGVDIDRSMGDVHPKGNPHYWLDPGNGRIIAGTIEARLAELDPEHADLYQKNLQSFRDQLDRAMFGPNLVDAVGADVLWSHQRAGDVVEWLKGQGKGDALGGWVARMAPHRGAAMVTFHKSWVYFAHAFGLNIVDQLEPKPGIPPTAAHLVEVIHTMQQKKINVILEEPFYDPKPAELVASKTGATVVQVSNSVGGDEGVNDYIALIDTLVTRVAAALEKKES
jgi:zinc/manganese transport system substrate-binding protein